MGYAVMMAGDRFEAGYTHSNEGNKSQALVDLNASYQSLKNEMKGMGGSAQVNDLGLLTRLGNVKRLSMNGEITSYEDVLTREQELKIDIVNAFGSGVAQMGDFIAEVMQSLGAGSPLSMDQKDQLFEMITEIANLKNLMNLGATPEAQIRIEAMISETVNKIADLLLDGLNQKITTPAITEFVHQMLQDVGAQYDIPDLSEKMVKIEGRMNPESYLKDSIAEMIVQLNELMDSQDLSDEVKAEIEDLIEKMELAAENGEPLPRDVMKALETLGETYSEINLSQTFIDTLDTLKDANIVMKAETLGISIDQVQSIESAIETLEAQQQALNEQDAPSVEEALLEIEALIEKLTAFVDEGAALDQETIQSLESIMETFPNLDIGRDFPSTLLDASQPMDTAIQKTDNSTVSNANISLETREINNAPSFIPAIAIGGGGVNRAVEVSTPVPIKQGGNRETIVNKVANENRQPTVPETPRDDSNPKLNDPDTAPLLPPEEQPTENKTDPKEPEQKGVDDPADDGVGPSADPVENEPERNDLEGDDSRLDDDAPDKPQISDPDNPEGPIIPVGGGDKPKPDTSDKPDKTPDPEGNEPDKNEKEKPNDPKNPCGEGVCTCGDKFNKNATYEKKDGMILFRDEKGNVIEMTVKEADKRITEEMTSEKGLNLDEKNWDNIVNRFDGDTTKAREFVIAERQQESDIAKQTQGKKIDYDADQKSVNDLDAQMRAKAGNKPEAPSRENTGDPSKKPEVKGPFHECDPNCDHTGKNKPRHKAEGIDITSMKTNKPKKPRKPSV